MMVWNHMFRRAAEGVINSFFCEQPNPEPLVCATDFSVKWCPPPAVPSATWHTPHILALRGERAYAHSSPSHWRFLLLKLTSSVPMHPATGGVSNPGPLGWHTRTRSGLYAEHYIQGRKWRQPLSQVSALRLIWGHFLLRFL